MAERLSPLDSRGSTDPMLHFPAMTESLKGLDPMSERDSSREACDDKKPAETVPFDFTAYPPDTLFYERRGPKPEDPAQQPPPPRPKKERRRRVDPTTFEKQYTTEELEFMNAMQRFKVQSGKTFPSHGEVLRVARRLGYSKSDEGTEPASDE
jgi:hypothetical protein